MSVLPKLALLVLFSACSVGEVPGEGSGTPDAPAAGPNQLSFNAMIKPLVANCLGCHSTGQPPNLTSFDTLEAKFKVKPGNTNILVTKGHATNNQHPVGIPYFTPDQKTTVTTWIDGLQ
jgi:hypothetical protein